MADIKLLTRAEQLARELGLHYAFYSWQNMRALGDGSGRVTVTNKEETGEGVFWQEDSKTPGNLYMFSPKRVLTALERRDVATLPF